MTRRKTRLAFTKNRRKRGFRSAARVARACLLLRFDTATFRHLLAGSTAVLAAGGFLSLPENPTATEHKQTTYGSYNSCWHSDFCGERIQGICRIVWRMPISSYNVTPSPCHVVIDRGPYCPLLAGLRERARLGRGGLPVGDTLQSARRVDQVCLILLFVVWCGDS